MPGIAETQTANGSELVITRTFDAPRDLVWKAWTDPEHMKQWSAPKGFTISTNEGDLRIGGGWQTCMRKDDGTELRLRGVYREIGEPERLVFTHAWDDGNSDPGQSTLVTVTLAEEGRKTRMTLRQSGFASADARDDQESGWNECFDRLAELL